MSTRLDGSAKGPSASDERDDGAAKRARETERVIASPEIRRMLEEFVRRRVASSDADDVVQTVLCEALASPQAPTDREELRKWLIGVARHKVADVHRKTAREAPIEVPEPQSPPAPVEARSMVGWAEKQAASAHDASQTLAWMAREGEGEKLESIAADAQLPAARVRQRVSRLRRWMKERWLAELAAVAVLTVAALVAWKMLGIPDEAPEAVVPDVPAPLLPEVAPEAPAPIDPRLERARALRADAFGACDRGAWADCERLLDEARAIDLDGDAAPEVSAARARARDALRTDDPKAPAPKSVETAPKSSDFSKPPPVPAPSSPSFDGAKRAPAPTSTPPPQKQKSSPKPSGKSSFDGSLDGAKK